LPSIFKFPWSCAIVVRRGRIGLVDVVPRHLRLFSGGDPMSPRYRRKPHRHGPGNILGVEDFAAASSLEPYVFSQVFVLGFTGAYQWKRSENDHARVSF
jgi:hypothetical protein